MLNSPIVAIVLSVFGYLLANAGLMGLRCLVSRRVKARLMSYLTGTMCLAGLLAILGIAELLGIMGLAPILALLSLPLLLGHAAGLWGSWMMGDDEFMFS